MQVFRSPEGDFASVNMEGFGVEGELGIGHGQKF